ncbi:DUF6515 family protein [Pseudomonas sp. M30-35]|uniref:DUF6515 family protein n=1 Tax=Pseudomonas sp. M30-35 TaxID=1981174 RepID=UPI000B3C6D49|nr:DUF6515 family protein [Pseudomonas sp. M30-35]ARU87229.1 hypothetical protein B9K09_04175 [Pseudomonas sp. M30-35]
MIKRFKWVEIGVLVLLGLSPLVQASPKHEQQHRDKHSVVKVVKVERKSPRISHLPVRHQRIRYNHGDYYVADGRWYKPAAGRYVRVAPPYGYTVRQLPRGARQVWVRGVKYHRVSDSYYRWQGKRGYYQVVRVPRG